MSEKSLEVRVAELDVYFSFKPTGFFTSPTLSH